MVEAQPQPGVSETSAAATAAFMVDKSRLTSTAMADQASELQQLGLTVYNQDEFEQGEDHCPPENWKGGGHSARGSQYGPFVNIFFNWQ